MRCTKTRAHVSTHMHVALLNMKFILRLHIIVQFLFRGISTVTFSLNGTIILFVFSKEMNFFGGGMLISINLNNRDVGRNSIKKKKKKNS